MASKHLSPDQLNFTRLGIACVDLIRTVLNDILRGEIKPEDLYNAITLCPELTSGRQKLRPEQNKICYLPSPSIPDYKTFDATLSYTLIRNLCPRLKPTNGWGKTPSHMETQIGDDIERLRVFRNEVYGHLNSSIVTDAEFKSQWRKLKSVIQRIHIFFFTSHGLSVDYKIELEKIYASEFGFEDMDKYKILLEGMLILSRKTENEDVLRLSIRGEDRVKCGDEATFECVIEPETGYLSVTWQRVKGNITEQLVINEDKYRGSSNRRLVIPKMLKEDEGEYQAVISRESSGKKEKMISNSISLVAVGERADLQEFYVSTTLNEISFHYKYKVSDDSPRVDDIIWTKNGQILSIDQMKYIGGSLTDAHLTVTSPISEDAGHYTCTIINAVGAVSESLTLDVPKANITTEKAVSFGSEGRITSVISSCPIFEEVSWQKSSDSISFETIDITEPKYFGSKLDSSNPDLIFSKATFDDRLYYRLFVRNKIGKCLSNVVLLNVTGGSPNISNSHETNIQNGSEKLITEIFLNDLSPRVTEILWFKNNEAIDISGSRGKYAGGSIDNPYLLISDVNEHDAGSYQCRALNAVGSTLGNAIVLERPSIDFARTNYDEAKDIFTCNATISSLPGASRVKWMVKKATSDDFQPIDVLNVLFKGSVESLPNPVLVVHGYTSTEFESFQIEVRNFIGTSCRIIGNVKETNKSMEGGKIETHRETMWSLTKRSAYELFIWLFYNARELLHKRKVTEPSPVFAFRGSTIRFDRLRLELIKEIELKDLPSLKQSLKVIAQIRDSEALQDVTSIADFFQFLIDKEIAKEGNVIMIQHLMRMIERPDLDEKCVKYAKKDDKTLCFFAESEQPANGYKHVGFHIAGDVKDFSKKDIESLISTVAAIVDCHVEQITIAGLHPTQSFIILLQMKTEIAQKLEYADLKQLSNFKIDKVIIDRKEISILQTGSRRLETVSRRFYEIQMSNVLNNSCGNMFKQIIHKCHLTEKLLLYREEFKRMPTRLFSRDELAKIVPVTYFTYYEADLPLLYILLKTICDIPAHEQGWGNPPSPTDTSLAANIDRIMEIHQNFYDSGPRMVLKQWNINEVMESISQIVSNIEKILDDSIRPDKRYPGYMDVRQSYQTDKEETFLKRNKGRRIESIEIEIEGPCTNLFRKILNKHLPDENLLSRLSECEEILKPLLGEGEHDHLYPKGGSPLCSQHISKQYYLLKTICEIPAHQQGWGNLPHPNDKSLAANIDRIMEIWRYYDKHDVRGVSIEHFDRVMKKVFETFGEIEKTLKHDKNTMKYLPDTDTETEYKTKHQLPHKDNEEEYSDTEIDAQPRRHNLRTSSITVPGVDGVNHISFVTPCRLWVNDGDVLVQMDSAGHLLHFLPIRSNTEAFHTVTQDGDLLFLDSYQVIKLTLDGTITKLFRTYAEASCIYSSRINGDILVGSSGKVTRYDRTGRELQEDDKGQVVCRSPAYITENKNGDIWTSDRCKKAVIVVDKSGSHRFNYKGRQSESNFSPHGICTDVLGQVLVCDLFGHSVHLLDQDGKFLSLLLTQEKDGIGYPKALCVDDQYNLYLGHEDSNTINVYKYLKDIDVK